MKRKLLSLIIAVLLLAAVVLPLGSSAAEMGDPPQIIINAGPGQVFDGDNDFFEAYKIFSVTFSGDNYSYTLLPEFYAFIDYPDYLTMSLQEYLDTQPGYEEMSELATALWNYIYYEGYDPLDIVRYVEPVGDVVITESQVTIDLDVTGGGYGYYLVFHSVSADNGGDPSVSIIAACSLTTTNPVAVVTPKADVPTLRKNIVRDDGTLTKIAGVTVGETVNFVIEVTLPKTYEGYDDYLFVLHDEFSGVSGAFIGFDPTGEDYLDAITVSMWEPGEPTTIEPFPTTGYTLTQNWPSFDIEFDFEALLEAPEGYELLVEYSGVVNGEAANVGTTTKVVNSAWLEFGANPYTEGSVNSIEEKVWMYVGCLDDVWKVDGTTKEVVEGTGYVKLDDPAWVAPNAARGGIFSSDGKYLAIGFGTAPYFALYNMSSGHPVKVVNPSSSPDFSSYATSFSFSPDGSLMVMTAHSAPYIAIYDISTSPPVKKTNPITVQSNSAYGSAISPDGKYLVVTNQSAPPITIYDMTSDPPLKMVDLPSLPSSGSVAAKFSPNGKLLVIGLNSAPFLAFYDMTGPTPIKVDNPIDLPTWAVEDISFSPNGKLLAIQYATSPYLTLYSVNDGIINKINDPDTMPTDGGGGLDFSPDGKNLVVCFRALPCIIIYDINGEDFIMAKNQITISTPITARHGVSFSPNGLYLAFSTLNTTPYINIYRTPTPAVTTYSTHLNSAEFTLQKLEPRDTPDSNGYLYDISAPIQFTEDSSENIVYDGDTSNTNIFTKLISSPEVTVAGLGPGLYMLTETKAPNGFNQLTYNVFIEISLEYNEDIEDWVYVRKAFFDKGNTFLKESNPAPFTIVNDSINSIYESIYIENFSGQLFPETGGIGTTIFYATSLLLTAALTTYAIASARKRKTNPTA